MGDSGPQLEGGASSAQSAQRDHLRTIAFRIREIQRLLAMRVEQENRRLESDGIEPVTDTNFREAPSNRSEE